MYDIAKQCGAESPITVGIHLHHSFIADAHRLEFGPLSSPGNLAFIEADGRLRHGHEVFNEY